MEQTQERLKILVLFLATFMLVIGPEKAIPDMLSILGIIQLQYTLSTSYLILFQENLEIQAMINSGSEINAMMPTYTARLSLSI